MRLLPIFTLLLLCAFPARSQQGNATSLPIARPATAPSPLTITIQALLANAAVGNAQWGVSVTTLTGETVYSLNEAQYFTPASNAKLFTTAAAFALLGADFISKTYLIQEGTVDAKGALKGGLRLVGTGDPSLSNRTYPYVAPQLAANGKAAALSPSTAIFNDFVDSALRAGIQTVDGPITGDDTFFVAERYGEGWGWDDLQWEYGAPISALSFNDNFTTLELKAGSHAGDPISAVWHDGFPYYATEWEPAGITADPGSDKEIGVSRDPGSMTVRLFGSAPAGGRPTRLDLAIGQPAAYAAQAFRAALEAHGIHTSSPASAHSAAPASTVVYAEELRKPITLQPLAMGASFLPIELKPGQKILATHVSPPLSQEATVINKVSQNLHAELLLRQLGKSQTGEGSIVEGARVVRQFLVNSGIDPNDFFFYDGSGMSPQDDITPRATTALLAFASRQPWGAAYRATLPIAGVDGTLAERFTQSPVKGKLFAKTGTLDGVRALSGYMIAASGRTLAIAIYCNHRRPGNDAERKTLDKIVEAVYRAN